MRIWITGAGIVSAIGNNKAQTLEALRSRRSGIAPIHYLSTEHQEFPVGEVKMSDEQMKELLGIHEEPTTRSALMGILALKEAMDDACLHPDDHPCFINATTVGGMDKTERYYLDILDHDSHQEYVRTHDCGACTEMIASYFGVFEMMTTVSTACSSAANALVLGARLIQSGRCEQVIVGGTECLTKYHLNGFHTLMILDDQPCRPFDATRKGLNLGEGAAYLVLESEASARRRGLKAKAILSGYANACDAFHQTASSENGEGAFLAMTEALQMASLTPSDIQYVNAHGTGTPNNDASESAALKRVYGMDMPAVSSTKSFTGHTTSASGTVEGVICLLALAHQFIPVNLNWQYPMEGGVSPWVGDTDATNSSPLRHVMCNSFAFGGNDTSFILSSPEEDTPSFKSYPSLSENHSPAFKRVFIRSAAQISIQQPLSDDWYDHPIHYGEVYTRAIDPDFRTFLNPLQSRRMGKILRRALVTAKQVVKESGEPQIDAIITGTGMGCLENTELFLGQLCREGESLLKPTHFMQSTHNTIGSMLAIQLGCHGYNTTYSHKGLSFDTALLDAFLQLRMGEARHILVCGCEELTPLWFSFLQKTGVLGQPHQTVAGEGSVTMMLTTDPEGALCELEDVKITICPSGVSSSPCSFSSLFGTGFLSSAFDVYAAVKCLQRGRMPNGETVESLELVNRQGESNVSFIQLRRISCD